MVIFRQAIQNISSSGTAYGSSAMRQGPTATLRKARRGVQIVRPPTTAHHALERTAYGGLRRCRQSLNVLAHEESTHCRRTACLVTEVVQPVARPPGQLRVTGGANLRAQKSAEVSAAEITFRNARHKDQRLLRCDAVQSGKNMAPFHVKTYCCRVFWDTIKYTPCNPVGTYILRHN